MSTLALDKKADLAGPGIWRLCGTGENLAKRLPLSPVPERDPASNLPGEALHRR